MLCIAGHAADPQLVMDMLAADQQGPADGLGVPLHSRLPVPVVGKVPNQGLVLGQPVLHALDLRNGRRLGRYSILHGPDRGQLFFHIHVHRSLLRLEAQDGVLHDAVPAAGGDGHQEIFPGQIEMGAPFQPFLDLGEGGCHGELDIRLLLGVRTHQSATGHMGVGGGHAIEEVALIGSSIVILLGVHGLVGAGDAALRSP